MSNATAAQKRASRQKRKALKLGKLPEQTNCGAATRKGGTCSKAPGWGTDHPGSGACRLHGGSTPNGVKHAQLVEAVQGVQQYGLPRTIDPHTALLEELARTAGHVDWLRLKVGELDDEALTGPVGEAGTDERTGTNHTPRYEPHVLLRMYEMERKHLTSVAATCIKAGIEERRVRLAEQQGQLIAQVLTGVLNELGVDTGADKTRAAVRKHLGAINGSAQLVGAA